MRPSRPWPTSRPSFRPRSDSAICSCVRPSFWRERREAWFCTGFLHEQREQQRRKFLLIAPFAEELNKSRHVLAALCLALGERGHDVLMPDLYGTGDSAGDFGDATLEIWRRDLDNSIAHLEPGDRLELIGMRTGALLAADAVQRHAVRSLTLLHPVATGRQQLNQMLRLRLAGGLTGEGEKETASQLRHRLAQDEGLEVAGYRLSGRLGRTPRQDQHDGGRL